MFDLTSAPDDDPGFVELVSGLIVGASVRSQPPDVLIYKIDNWFGDKWVRFSGKTLGLAGVWSSHLTIPPFVSNRIVAEWRFRRDEAGDGYHESDPIAGIHHQGWSARNLNRRVDRIAADSALFWWSGNTAATGRGSLMGYVRRLARSTGTGSWISSATGHGRSRGERESTTMKFASSRKSPLAPRGRSALVP